MTREQLQAWLDERGLTRFMASRITAFDAQAQTIEVTVDRREELEGGVGEGHWHGGAIASLIDTAATFAVLGAGAPQAPTASVHVDLIRPATTPVLIARAVVRRMGRTLAIVDADAYDAEDRLVATGRLTFVVRAG